MTASILCQAHVDEILVENGRATGVRLKDGVVVKAREAGRHSYSQQSVQRWFESKSNWKTEDWLVTDQLVSLQRGSGEWHRCGCYATAIGQCCCS